MEVEKEKYNSLQKLCCAQHKNVPVTFVCISHTDCPKNNLLCMQCIDEMNGAITHQLISVRKFCKYIFTYETQAGVCLANTKQMMKTLRGQINEKLNQIEYFLIGNSQNQILLKQQNLESLREKTKLIAKRKLWARLQKKRNQGGQLDKQIKSQIKSTEKNTIQVLDELLSYSKTCFDRLRQEPKIELQNGDTSLRNKIKKRENNKDMEQEDQVSESEKQSEEDNDQSSVMSVSEQIFPAPRKNRKSRYKRYSIQQKIKILSEVKNGVDKKVLAKKFRISTSTILRWQKAFQGQMKIMSKISKPNKKPEQIEVNEIKAEDDHQP